MSNFVQNYYQRTGMEYLKKGLGISKDPMSERYYPKYFSKFYFYTSQFLLKTDLHSWNDHLCQILDFIYRCEVGPYIAEDVRRLRLKAPKIEYD